MPARPARRCRELCRRWDGSEPNSASFSAEAFERLRVARQFIREELEGNEAAEACVFGLVHHTHPTAAKFLDDAVVRNGFADERVRAGHVGHILGCVRNQVNKDRLIQTDWAGFGRGFESKVHRPHSVVFRSEPCQILTASNFLYQCTTLNALSFAARIKLAIPAFDAIIANRLSVSSL
jgi:hypothetical protein